MQIVYTYIAIAYTIYFNCMYPIVFIVVYNKFKEFFSRFLFDNFFVKTLFNNYPKNP